MEAIISEFQLNLKMFFCVFNTSFTYWGSLTFTDGAVSFLFRQYKFLISMV